MTGVQTCALPIYFKRLKKLMRQPLIVDGRNIYDPQRMHTLGFRYLGVGRGRLREPR